MYTTVVSGWRHESSLPRDAASRSWLIERVEVRCLAETLISGQGACGGGSLLEDKGESKLRFCGRRTWRWWSGNPAKGAGCKQEVAVLAHLKTEPWTPWKYQAALLSCDLTRQVDEVSEEHGFVSQAKSEGTAGIGWSAQLLELYCQNTLAAASQKQLWCKLRVRVQYMGDSDW